MSSVTQCNWIHLKFINCAYIIKIKYWICVSITIIKKVKMTQPTSQQASQQIEFEMHCKCCIKRQVMQWHHALHIWRFVSVTAWNSKKKSIRYKLYLQVNRLNRLSKHHALDRRIHSFIHCLLVTLTHSIAFYKTFLKLINLSADGHDRRKKKNKTTMFANTHTERARAPNAVRLNQVYF